MTPISGPGPVRAPAIARPVTGTAPERRSPRPVTDEYVPEEPREPYGRYWPGKDEAGQPKICFDGPSGEAKPKAAESAPAAPEENADPEKGGGPEKPPEKKGRPEKEERCVTNTDQVDREIERLKKRQEALKQRIRAEPDEARARDLERQLAQVERELSQKDNDAYRRQHSTYTQLA